MIKYFRFGYDYVLWEISFSSLSMLLATIPVYENSDVKDSGKQQKKVKKAKDEKGREIDFMELEQFLNIQ